MTHSHLQILCETYFDMINIVLYTRSNYDCVVVQSAVACKISYLVNTGTESFMGKHSHTFRPPSSAWPVVRNFVCRTEKTISSC